MSEKIYRPNCSVCQYMKKNRDFRFRIMQSTYFNPEGHESPVAVNKAFGYPFKEVTLYAHLQRHQKKDRLKVAPVRLAVPEIVDGIEVNSRATSEHELGLDEFIKEGRERLIRREMEVTASTYLKAISIKADIEKSTKDRKADMVKAFFGAKSEPKDEKSLPAEG